MEIQFFEDTDRRELWLAQMKNCSWRAGRYLYTLLKEDRSVSTRENLLFSVNLLEKEGGAPREIAIVTSEFHEARAGLIAKKLGLHAGAVTAITPLWLLPTFYVRELYGLLYQIFL